MTHYLFAWGFKTRLKAELEILNLIADSLISEAEKPRVTYYRNRAGVLRYAIELKDLTLE